MSPLLKYWIKVGVVIAVGGGLWQYIVTKHRTERAEQKRIECLDRFCEGDVDPRQDKLHDALLKLNGQFFIGPKEYFSSGNNSASFEWWDHKPISSLMKRPNEVQELAKAGKGYDTAIDIFLGSNSFPKEPTGYRLIQLAEEKNWIASRNRPRPGLEIIQMKHVQGPDGYMLDRVDYYVATELRGVDGLPPVATCAQAHPDSVGGTGFMWKPGIWIGARMHHKHCADWPEIYSEVLRVLSLLKKA